jgi:hypothetical protein
MVMVKWSIFTDISTKKSGIVEIVMIKFGFDILTTVILEFGMVMVKFGVTILTIEPQFGQMVKNSWSSNPPPLSSQLSL